ncbi:hypothetical protein [Actinomadura rugatobispora]|uniref:Uncharacterized protein n=1 Tax=Actinomadura rugatobispora TaxID=1994 RepID=A0ABW1AAR2_9ACTN|nr:hypothetical protein GCM10010200_052260 [Actinomadura rugatobispora]
MELRDAAGMLLAESAAHPELLRLSRHAYDELAAGRAVDHTVLSEMLREGARKDVYGVLKRKYGEQAFENMVMVLAREVDRQAPVVVRR